MDFIQRIEILPTLLILVLDCLSAQRDLHIHVPCNDSISSCSNLFDCIFAIISYYYYTYNMFNIKEIYSYLLHYNVLMLDTHTCLKIFLFRKISSLHVLIDLLIFFQFTFRKIIRLTVPSVLF